MWAARVPWTAAARYAAGACAASLRRRRRGPRRGPAAALVGRFRCFGDAGRAVGARRAARAGWAPPRRGRRARAADRVAQYQRASEPRRRRAAEFVEDLTTEEAAPVVMEARPTMDLPRTIARVLDLPLRGTLEKRPWWEALVWPRGAGTDVLLRSHHCIADGASFGALFGNLSDQREEIDALLRQGPRRRRRAGGAPAARRVRAAGSVAAPAPSRSGVVVDGRRGAATPAAAADPADRRVGVGRRRRVLKRREEAGARRDRQRPVVTLVAAALRTSVSRDAACAVPVRCMAARCRPV